MHMHTQLGRLTTLVAAALCAAGAHAVVLFEARSGTGQADAADVRVATGWSEAHTQERMMAATFRFQLTEEVTVVCAAPAQGGMPAAEDHLMWQTQTEGELNTAPRFDPRNPRRLVGVLFTGTRLLTHTAPPAPQPGQPCTTRLGAPGQVVTTLPRQRMQALSIEHGGVSARLPF